MTDGKLVGKYSRILSPPDGWGWGGWGGDSPEAGSTAMSRGSLGDWAPPGVRVMMCTFTGCHPVPS